MQLTQSAPLQQATPYRNFGVEDWDAQLRSVCGAFHTKAETGGVTGSVSMRSLLGIDIAWINVSPSHIVRNQQDVRSDDAAYYFLIGQKAAHAHIQHGGRSEFLQPGDMVLVDSSQPSQFIYTGAEQASISQQVSVHIPRYLLEGKLSSRHVGERIAADTDLAQCVWEQIAALEEVADLLSDKRLHTESFRGLFLTAFTRMFQTDRHQKRFVQVMLALLKEAAGQSYGVDYFADMSASSRRTFCRVFEQRETSFGELLKYIRLLRFLKLCNGAAQLSARPSISSLIYQAGFSDVSNFNHLFKAHFGISPGMLVSKD